MTKDELQSQINDLANFIMREIEGEPSRSEGAVECAIRIMSEAKAQIVPNLFNRELARKHGNNLKIAVEALELYADYDAICSSMGSCPDLVTPDELCGPAIAALARIKEK